MVEGWVATAFRGESGAHVAARPCCTDARCAARATSETPGRPAARQRSARIATGCGA